MIEHDPIVERLRTSLRPFTWSEMSQDSGADPDRLRMIRQARDAGWEDGVVVPIPRGGHRCGVVGLVRGKGEFSESEKAELASASVLFHSLVRRRATAVSFAAEPAVISRRISDVLTQSACGMTDREIAESLSLSSETVREHLQIARAKLHAKNKVEAVALALALGVVLF